jgi:hypothetical protein
MKSSSLKHALISHTSTRHLCKDNFLTFTIVMAKYKTSIGVPLPVASIHALLPQHLLKMLMGFLSHWLQMVQLSHYIMCKKYLIIKFSNPISFYI